MRKWFNGAIYFFDFSFQHKNILQMWRALGKNEGLKIKKNLNSDTSPL